MSTRKMLIAFVTVLLLAAVVAGVDAWKTYAQGPGGNGLPCDQAYSGMMGGQGMMGGWRGQGTSPCPGGMMGMMNMMGGQGMMDGWNGQQGWAGQNGYGMMGGWTSSAELAPAGDALTLDEATAVAEAYIAAQNDSNLALGEVMQFSNNFYAQAVEVESGRSAFEFLIDPATGTVYPEPGPNMMWNLRYGMHTGTGMMGQWNVPAGADGVEMTVSPEQARESAQQFLDTSYSELIVASEGDTFYGYYTFEVLQGESVVGMLSINGYTGQVWIHTWHGDFTAATENTD